MIAEDLDEPIRVRADFGGGKIVPRVFRRSGRKQTITKVNADWIDRSGQHPVHNFSVQVGDDTYFLEFKSGEASWRLTKVILEG